MPKTEKIFNNDLFHGYAVLHLTDGNRDFMLFASEEDSSCLAFDLDNDFQEQAVWDSVGGTMSLIQIGDSLDFLATQKFYPGFNSAECQIVLGKFNGTGWDISKITDFPYLHRFDLIPHQNEILFVGCTICRSKKTIDDWSDPGEVFVGVYNVQNQRLDDLHALDIRITKNHGYLGVRGVETYSLITGDEGIFRLDLPNSEADWQIKKIFDKKVSDVAVVDAKGDGKLNYLTIEDFHGPEMFIYDEKFTELYKHPEATPFGHVVWGGYIYGEPLFIFGAREGSRDLFFIKWNQSKEVFETELIDKAVGTSNITVFEKAGVYYIQSANRETNKIAVYKIKGED